MSDIAVRPSAGTTSARTSRARRTLALAGLAHALHDGYTSSIDVLRPVWQSQFTLGYGVMAVLRALSVGGLALPIAADRAVQQRHGRECVSGVCSEGFQTMLLAQTKASAAFPDHTAMGKLKAEKRGGFARQAGGVCGHGGPRFRY